MKLSSLSAAALLALAGLSPVEAASTSPLALFAVQSAGDLSGAILVRGGGDDHGNSGRGSEDRSGRRGGDDDHDRSGHGGGDDDHHDDDHGDDDDDDDHDDDSHDDNDDSDDDSDSGRDKPRIPGGSGCDDPGDVIEHPECRLP